MSAPVMSTWWNCRPTPPLACAGYGSIVTVTASMGMAAAARAIEERRIIDLANLDALTGLANRRAGLDLLRDQIAKAEASRPECVYGTRAPLARPRKHYQWFYSQRGDNVTNRLAVLLVRDLRRGDEPWFVLTGDTLFVGDAPRAAITQRNADSLAEIVQDGTANQLDLEQEGTAPHRAQIVQDGDNNSVTARQDGDGSTDLALAQEGNGNTVLVSQNEESALAETAATIVQRGNGNSIILAQDGSDNQAQLTQEGDSNVMTASQLDSGTTSWLSR